MPEVKDDAEVNGDAEVESLSDRGADWLTTGERGTILGIRFFVFLATVFGRWPARIFLRVVIFYYAVFARAARQSSRKYLQRLAGRLDDKGLDRLGLEPPHRNEKLAQDKALEIGFWTTYRHLLRFGEVTLDRIFLLKGKTKYFEVSRHGYEHFDEMREKDHGSLLLGAHLGSFDAMRLVGRNEGLPINILAYFGNARMINALLKQLNPDANTEILDIQPGDPSAVMKASEKLEAGEFVAMLGDRVGINDKQVTVDFLGGRAPFPTGPFLMASILRVPIYLTFGLYHPPNHYSIHCEPFAENLRFPRGPERDEAVQEVVQRYANRLEEYVLKAPDNWFNFYDFWSPEQTTEPAENRDESAS